MPAAFTPRAAFRAAAILLACLALPGGWMAGCASHYCGAPCDPKPGPADPPRDVHVNQYGSLYGYREVDSLTPVQLKIERNSLEFLIKADLRDAEILKALKAEGDSAYAFKYEDNSTGGQRFNASGKLRRAAVTEAGAGRITRLIGDSQNRELFERYRKVRWRMIQEERSAALVPPVVPAAPPPETLWTGSYRADADTLVQAPAKFQVFDSCGTWATTMAAAHRDKAYAFEYECRKGEAVVKRKLW